MITTPTWATIPSLGTTATKNVTGLDQANLYAPGVLFPAEHLNQFTYWFANNANVDQSAVTSILAENQNAVTTTGQALAPADNFQLAKTIIAMSHQVGELINTEIPLTPAIWTSGSANYVPVIPRWDADHVVSSAQAPDLYSKYMATVATVNVNGVSTNSWTSTGSSTATTIFFTSNAANLALLNLLTNEALANGYIQTQTVGAGAYYTYASGLVAPVITVGGTECQITGVSIGGLSISVNSGAPTGSRTIQVYPYRAAPYAGISTCLLKRLSGFVGVAQYDYDGMFVAGFRKMDQMQGHRHNATSSAVTAGSGVNGLSATPPGASGLVFDPVTDGTSGTPRTGKTTQPQTYALYPHTWAGRLLA